MPIINISEPNSSQSNSLPSFTFFTLGFRPFFLGAGIFSALSMFAWMGIYNFNSPFTFSRIPIHFSHAHEMIFGYSMAVIAGFLLTAIKNWTGVQTLQNKPLMLLFFFWLMARIGFLIGEPLLLWSAAFDLLFNLYLSYAVTIPILQAKQWKQMAIISKVIILFVLNVFFYLGAFGIIDMGLQWGLYGGFFLIIGLILTMGRRVIPMFIENGVNYPVKLANPKVIDMSSLIFFLLFSINEVFIFNDSYTLLTASSLSLILMLRLKNWYTHGIWQSPLLWGLYLSVTFVTFGVMLFAISIFAEQVTRSLALHSMALGSIAIVTLAMMSRVVLGHTGRSIKNPSKWSTYILYCILGAILFRVILPIFFSTGYEIWIFISQVFWIVAFLLFSIDIYPQVSKPRVDGNPG